MPTPTRISGFIFARFSGETPQYFFSELDMSAHGWALVCPHVLEFTPLPEYDPAEAKRAVLRQQRESLAKRYEEDLALLDKSLTKLG